MLSKRQSLKVSLKSWFWYASVCLPLVLYGCTATQRGVSESSSEHAFVFGYVHVVTDGPNPRRFPTHLRFVSLSNMDSGEKYRIDIHSNADLFSHHLPIGHYSVDRVQFNEGPFMAESHVHIEFQVPHRKATYIGIWKFEVETPRTVRLVRIHVVEGDPAISQKFPLGPVSKRTPIETILPQPNFIEVRVFPVAPNPKIKYFYR